MADRGMESAVGPEGCRNSELNSDEVNALGQGEARRAAWSYGGRAEHILRIRLSREAQPIKRRILEAALAQLPEISNQRLRRPS